jgi:hypothetical protein
MKDGEGGVGSLESQLWSLGEKELVWVVGRKMSSILDRSLGLRRNELRSGAPLIRAG